MIKLILLDVDGTLSDGKIYYNNKGEEYKAFDVKDGLGLRVWKKLGRKSAIITGRESPIVEKRGNELGVDDIFMGVENKAEAVKILQEKYSLSKEEIACIGDDCNDLPMFAQSGLKFAPLNAADMIKKYADVILSKRGGEGAVREMIEILMHQEKLEERWLEIFT
ncbi:KdsC family phosphatase [Helicobacter cholecystus]|uniref:KdsC family phosphatase n=1 Tax=Helicobacter cholecystus TaxID=45498 RepID=UPI002739EE3B|nr:HAD hydrolase family protein [Helicobacter cholecystus]